MNKSSTSVIDQLIGGIDQTLRHLYSGGTKSQRPAPVTQDASENDKRLDQEQRLLSGRLMRVNHAGEIAAQALYQGQALAAREEHVAQSMKEAAEEENDHLAWCEQRLNELDCHTSILNPLWYAGSFAIGYAAGIAGDRWSLGFIGETERQVVNHLDGHLQRLPADDDRSRDIISLMKEDEERHGQNAMKAGGEELPGPIRGLMRLTSRVMTRSSFWI